METYQLRTFAAVAKLGQLTRAGEALHVSQPAITAQIKALEDELQVGLFARTAQGMRLTRAGENLWSTRNRFYRRYKPSKIEPKHYQGM